MSEKFINGGLKSHQKIAVGIDQSLTGFALSAVSVSDPSKHKTWVFKSSKTGIERLADIRGWINFRLDGLEKDECHVIHGIAMEGTVVASHSASVLGELAAIVKMTLRDRYPDEPYRYPIKVPPMTLKKYAAGKGNAKKQEMLLQVFKRWGVEFDDDNAADAYSLGRLASGRADTVIEKGIVEQMQDLKYRDVSY